MFIDSVLFAVLDFFVGAIADWYDDVLRATLRFSRLVCCES